MRSKSLGSGNVQVSIDFTKNLSSFKICKDSHSVRFFHPNALYINLFKKLLYLKDAFVVLDIEFNSLMMKTLILVFYESLVDLWLQKNYMNFLMYSYWV